MGFGQLKVRNNQPGVASVKHAEQGDFGLVSTGIASACRGGRILKSHSSGRSGLIVTTRKVRYLGLIGTLCCWGPMRGVHAMAVAHFLSYVGGWKLS